MPQLNVNLSIDQNSQIEKVKEACERHGIKLNQFVFESVIEFFETGKWGKFFKEQGDLKWAILENVKFAEKLSYVKVIFAKFVINAKKIKG